MNQKFLRTKNYVINIDAIAYIRFGEKSATIGLSGIEGKINVVPLTEEETKALEQFLFPQCRDLRDGPQEPFVGV